MIIHNPILTGSFSVNGADLSTITGSVATSASFDARTTYLESTSSILTAASASQSVTSGSLVAASASLSATSGSLSAASGSFNTRVTALEATGSALSSSLLTVSGSGYATSGSLNTRVSALEVTGSALSSSLLTVSGSGYATSASLSAASGSFNSRVATIESKYATTGSNTFIDTQVVSGSILQSGSFTSTGTLTAQTLVIQTITSSVVYSSGSNVFGNSLGNSQVFTGSVLITGSLTIAGASSATSYSGVTIYGSTIACSPIGCFATSCATSFIGGTMSGTTIYGSTAVCSANGLLIGNGGVTATCNYLPKFTGTSTIGNSQIFDNGTNVGIGTATPSDPQGFGGALDIQNAGYGGVIYLRKSSATTTYGFFGYDQTALTATIAAFGANNKLLFNAGTGAIKMTLDASGNLGLGVTPFDNSLSVGLDIGIGAGLFGYNNRFILSANAYYNVVWKYKATASAAVIKSETDSSIQFLNAPSGTAGCAITFTQAMTLFSTGNLAVGTTTDACYKLDVNGTGRFSNNVLIEANQTSSPLFYAKQTGSSGYTAIQFSGNNGTDIGALTTYNGQIYFGSWNGGNGSFGQLQINKTTGVATFTCQVNAESFYTNDTRYVSNQIMAGYNTNSEDSDIWINYTGYQGGTTRFRDFRVGNGKQGQIAVFDGSTSAATFSGTVNVYDGSSHGLSISNSSGAITFTNNWSKTTFTVGSAQDIEFNDDAGVKRLFLSTGGSVGIGTVSPSAKLDIAQMGGDNTRTCNALYLRAGNNSDVFTSNQILFGYNCGTQYAHAIKTRHNSNNSIDNAIDFYTWKHGDSADTKAGQYVMTIAGNGRIGIGTCQPQFTIDLSSDDTTRAIQFYGGAGTDKYGIGKFGGSGATTVFHGGAGASNRVSLGCYNGTTYTPNFEVLGNGVICMINIGSGAGTYALKWNSSTKNVTYDTSSERYKDNIRNSTYGLCHILQLNSRMFEYKDQCRTDIGFIAEELYPIIPELVMLDENLSPNGVSYDRMVSVLVEGMKQQQCTINTLKTCLGIQ